MSPTFFLDFMDGYIKSLYLPSPISAWTAGYYSGNTHSAGSQLWVPTQGSSSSNPMGTQLLILSLLNLCSELKGSSPHLPVYFMQYFQHFKYFIVDISLIISGFFHPGYFRSNSNIKQKISRNWIQRRKKRTEEKKNFIRSFYGKYFLKGSLVNILLIHFKRSFLEGFCLSFIKSSHQKLEASSKRCFAEINVCRKHGAIL